MFVLDIGGQAAVAAVSLGPPSALSTPATVRVSTTNPLAAGRRRLAQAADPAAPAQQAPEELQGGLPSLTGGGVNCATDPLSPNSYQCAAARGQYIVLSGFQESPMAIAGLSVYLAQPPILLPPPPPPVRAPLRGRCAWLLGLCAGARCMCPVLAVLTCARALAFLPAAALCSRRLGRLPRRISSCGWQTCCWEGPSAPLPQPVRRSLLCSGLHGC